MTHDRQRGITLNRPDVDSVVETLQEHAIDVCVLDSFISIHAVPENDNGAIDLVAKTLADVADRCDCAIETIHHVRKGNGGELTVEDARGASALIGAARSVRVLSPMTPAEAAKADIVPNQRRLCFRIDNGKANMAPPAAAASWRRLVGVGLDNGTAAYPEDQVGVVTAWSWPDAFRGLMSDDLRAVQNKVAGGKWRADMRSADWVGCAIAETLELDLDEEVDRARVKTLLKTWLRNRSLVTVQRTDDGRKSRKFIEVGIWVEP